MKEYILFVDTETSGLPKDWNASYAEVDKWPYIVQLAWVVYHKSGKEVKSENHFIKALDYRINPESEKIHGISENMTLEKGETRKRVLKKIYNDLKNYQPLIVGHLMEFDSHMLSVGFRRSGLKNIIKDYPLFCTMTATSSYRRNLNTQYPKLDELYQTLFKKKLENHHNALEDAKATAACFFELVKRKEITDDTIKKQQKYFKKIKNNSKKTGCGLVLSAFYLFLLIGLIITAYTLI
ncbi:MAG: 3'-5' exonuclease [Bacteroidota bacterium]|nr:3'-5' exonuclease [Bacteroidota bacterium]